jgi:hypothetical protein
MISAARSQPGSAAHVRIAWIVMGMLLSAGYGRAEACALSPDHAGHIFPVERVDSAWACRLQSIIRNNSIESQLGPIHTALPGVLYGYLLDHPPFTAAMIRRLHLGQYQSEGRGHGRFWGDDGEGTKGIVELVYDDPTNRIYFLDGTHESRLLPHVTGQAVVFLRIGVMRDANGHETTVSTLVAYTKLDNPFLSGLVSLLHPLVSRIAASRLKKGVETVDRLGRLMREDPRRVLSEAEKEPGLPEQHVTFLRQALISWHSPDKGSLDGQSIP